MKPFGYTSGKVRVPCFSAMLYVKITVWSQV